MTRRPDSDGALRIVVDPDVEAVYPAKFGARVKLTLASGKVTERTVLECHGTPADACSRDEMLEKFKLLAGTRLSPTAVSDLAALVGSATTTPVRAIMQPLRGIAEMPNRKTA